MYNKIARVFLGCLAAALISTSCSQESSSGNRIVGGQIINVATAPYMVRLKHINGQHGCGGTLLTLQHVLTAAHCLDFVDPTKELVVVSGVSTLSEAGQQRRIVNYDKPAAYDRSTMHMDYAVLKLNSSMIADANTQAIKSLASQDLPAGTKVQVSGFGRQVGGGESSNHLRTILLPVITNEQCSTTFTLTNTMFCTAVPNQGPCQYDSGGPLVVGGVLHGIVSWGRSDCDYSTGSPSVFTSVKSVRSLILNAIEKL